MKLSEIFKVTGTPVIVASLCCLSPLIFVLLGLSTASFASDIADTLYGNYKWLFRTLGLIFLATSIVVYLRRQKGICTIDEAKRRRREIVNTVLITIIASIIGYVIFLYIIVEYAGVLVGIWK